MNFCITHLDLRLKIIQQLDLKDIHNIFLTNETCFNAYNSESFWIRKLKQDYPDVSPSTEISFLELYKRLTNKYGLLVTWRPSYIDHPQVYTQLYKAIITTSYNPVSVIYAIDEYHDLSIIATENKPRINLIDKYLEQFFHLIGTVNGYPLLTNIKYISGDSYFCLILTTDGILYQIVLTDDINIPENIAFEHKSRETYNLVKVDDNVTEVGSGEYMAYYIKKPNSLYVSDRTEKLFVGNIFKLISDHVKFATISGTDLKVNFIEQDGGIYEISEERQVRETELPVSDVIQIYDHIWS